MSIRKVAISKKKQNNKRKTMKGGVDTLIQKKASNFVTNLFDNVVNKNNNNDNMFQNASLNTPRILQTIRPSSKKTKKRSPILSSSTIIERPTSKTKSRNK